MAAAERPAPSLPTTSATFESAELVRNLLDRLGRLPGRQRDERESRRAKRREGDGPVARTREWDPQRRGHRGPDRLAIQRVTARGVEQHAACAKRRRVAEDAAHVVGVGHAVEDDEQPNFVQRLGRKRRRALDEREAAAVEVVAGQRCEVVRARDIDRRVGGRETRSEVACRRRVEQNRPDPIARIVEKTPDDDAAFRSEQAVRAQELGVCHASEQRDAGIAQVVHEVGAGRRVHGVAPRAARPDPPGTPPRIRRLWRPGRGGATPRR